jgi:hypothetical protein
VAEKLRLLTLIQLILEGLSMAERLRLLTLIQLTLEGVCGRVVKVVDFKPDIMYR